LCGRNPTHMPATSADATAESDCEVLPMFLISE
jgi:hypothetical protein